VTRHKTQKVVKRSRKEPSRAARIIGKKYRIDREKRKERGMKSGQARQGGEE
jgi:hypothetical protein